MEPMEGDQRLAITSLPFDILSQITMEVDNAGLFALRRTCRILHAVTKTRQVWYKLIRDLVQDYKVAPPEEEIDSYTVEELELWTVQRRRIRDAWHGPKLRFRSRAVEADLERIGEGIDSYQLLPGGRWLVVPRMQCMYFYDLDAPALVPRLLFDPETAKNGAAKYCRYWIDRSRGQLTFYSAGRAVSSDDVRAFVHRIELVGHGIEACLVANYLGSFGLEKPQWRYTPVAAVNDKYYVEVWGGMARVYHYQEIFERGEHPRLDASPIKFPIEGRSFWFMEFIHGNVFVLHAGQDLRLFEITSSKNHDSPRSIQLLHTISPFACQLRSRIQWMPGASQFVFLCKERLAGVHIPHDTSLPLTLVELGMYSGHIGQRESRALDVLGISTSLSFYGLGQPMEVTTHLWDGWAEETHYVRRPVLADIPGLIGSSVVIAYSEDVGRVVLCRTEIWRMELLILDPV